MVNIPFMPEDPISRRTLLKRLGGAAGVAMLPGALAAGGSDDSSSGGSSGSGGSGKADVGTVTFGSNASDKVPKEAYQKVFQQFQSSSGGTVDVNTVDHNTFQENINSYLQG